MVVRRSHTVLRVYHQGSRAATSISVSLGSLSGRGVRLKCSARFTGPRSAGIQRIEDRFTPVDCQSLGQDRHLFIVSAARQQGGRARLHGHQHKDKAAVQQVEHVQPHRDDGKTSSSVFPEEAIEIGIERRHRCEAE
jgi:hypothetical protein